MTLTLEAVGQQPSLPSPPRRVIPLVARGGGRCFNTVRAERRRAHPSPDTCPNIAPLSHPHLHGGGGGQSGNPLVIFVLTLRVNNYPPLPRNTCYCLEPPSGLAVDPDRPICGPLIIDWPSHAPLFTDLFSRSDAVHYLPTAYTFRGYLHVENRETSGSEPPSTPFQTAAASLNLCQSRTG